MTKPTAAANAVGLPEGRELLAALDHLSITKDFAEAAVMASAGLPASSEKDAMATLCNHVSERLQALSDMMGEHGTEVQS